MARARHLYRTRRALWRRLRRSEYLGDQQRPQQRYEAARQRRKNSRDLPGRKVPVLAGVRRHQHIWTANGPDNTVTKLRASDGKNLGTFHVGNSPIAIAFGGQNIWVTNYGDSTVTELRASDGATLRTITTGSGPLGIAFDGANMWVVTRGGGTATEIKASDGTILGNFPAPDEPYGIAFDGTYLWISGALYVEVMRASDGGVVAQWKIPPTTGAAFDGAHIWISNLNDKSLSKF